MSPVTPVEKKSSRSGKSKKSKKAAGVEPQESAETAAPSACVCAHTQPVTPGEPCDLCKGIIPQPAAELSPAADVDAQKRADEEALLSGEGAVGKPASAAQEVAAAELSERRPMTEAERIAESRKALLAPPPPGTKFFESPEGYIEIAEDNKPHVWCRYVNGGKGGWINPKRG